MRFKNLQFVFVKTFFLILVVLFLKIKTLTSIRYLFFYCTLLNSAIVKVK